MKTGFLSCIESRVENDGSLYGRFELSAFPAGQALTFANALRRTLLSELPGLSIIAVDIQGVSHEYSNFIGMRESILDFLLNLKKVILTSHFTNIQPQVGSLLIQGPAVIRAKDLKLPNFLACVNPNQYLCTLAPNGIIQMKFFICQGKNSLSTAPPILLEYLNNELSNKNFVETYNNGESFSSLICSQQKWEGVRQKQKKLIRTNKSWLRNENSASKEKNTVSETNIKTLLVLDAVFMPINKVNFVIQKQDGLQQFPFDRFLAKKNHFVPEFASHFESKSQLTASQYSYDLEKIILEIWTNGSIHPKKALHQGVKALLELFYPFQQKTSNIFRQLAYPNREKLESSIVSKTSSSLIRENFEKKLNVREKDTNFLVKNSQLSVEKKFLCLDIANLDLSLQSYISLKRSNINTIGNLLEYSPNQLLLLKNFGKRSLAEIEKNLFQMGLYLSSNV